MANLPTRIVVRTTGPQRSWIVANGKTDPAASYYIRSCVGSTPNYTHAGDTFEEAELADEMFKSGGWVERCGKPLRRGFTGRKHTAASRARTSQTLRAINKRWSEEEYEKHRATCEQRRLNTVGVSTGYAICPSGEPSTQPRSVVGARSLLTGLTTGDEESSSASRPSRSSITRSVQDRMTSAP